VQHILETGQIVYDSWYASEKGRRFLAQTDGGQWMFLWEAKYKDGTVIRQFGEIEFHRAMMDETYIPPESLRRTVDDLEKEHVSQFLLHPIALTRSCAPWFQRPIVVNLRPERGEFFLNYWLTDYTPKTGYRLRRHAIGIRKVVGDQEFRSLIVISPSGQITICADDNQSFEGE
jgi:hypothetical protein